MRIGCSIAVSNVLTGLGGNVQPPTKGLTYYFKGDNSLSASVATAFARVSSRNNPDTKAVLVANAVAYVQGRTGKGLMIEEGTTNLLSTGPANSIATSATCTTTAVVHTVSVGTGSLVLSGTMTATVTPGNPITAIATAGTLTLTGTATFTQVEAKPYSTSWQDPANGIRTAESLAFDPTTVLTPTKGTISLWSYANSTFLNTSAVGNGIIGTLTSGSNNVLNIYKFANTMNFTTSSAAGVTSAVSVTKTLTSGWHNISVTWGTANPKLYIDGILVSAAPTNNIPSAVGTSFLIGSDAWATGVNSSTKLQNVRIYNIELTAQEIKTLFNSGI